LQIVHKLHEAYIVHRDLKPDNIFLDSKLAVRVGDFGDACMGCDELGFYGGGTPNLGTQYYFAPELNSVGKVTEKVSRQVCTFHF
jgi:serine/threonine protein kinase